MPKEFMVTFRSSYMNAWATFSTGLWLYYQLDLDMKVFNSSERAETQRKWDEWATSAQMRDRRATRRFGVRMKEILRSKFSLIGLKKSAPLEKEENEVTEMMMEHFSVVVETYVSTAGRGLRDTANRERWGQASERAIMRSFLAVISRSMFDVLRAWHREFRQELNPNEDTPKVMTRPEIDATSAKIARLRASMLTEVTKFETWFTLGKVMTEYPQWWYFLDQSAVG